MSSDPTHVLTHFAIAPATVTPITTGLIHRTFRVDADDGRRYALQQVSPIFAREVHDDIEAVTAHLANKGLRTPRLVRASDGALSVALASQAGGEVWRVLTWLDGTTKARVGGADDAHTAAALLARFHAALVDLDHTFKARRLGVHDTARHLEVLRAALDAHGAHRLFAEVAPVGREILERATPLVDLSQLPDRVVHGDPKITNVLFDPLGQEATALVDLDTIAPMKLPHELGDALRSWSNPAGEDAHDVRFDAAIFEAALRGYGAHRPAELTHEELEAVAPGARLIILELAARFAADALRECYFGWDAARFATRGDHNLLRARAQLALARDFDRQAAELERAARRALL